MTSFGSVTAEKTKRVCGLRRHIFEAVVTLGNYKWHFFITFAFPVLPNISEAVVTTGNYKWKCFSTFAFLIEDQTR